MSGVNLKYVASSGREYNLRSETLRTRRGASFHAWKYDPSAVALQHGERVTAFTKDAANYEATLTLFGTEEEKLALLDQMHDDFELDMRDVNPGRLIWNDYYIECFVVECETDPDDSNFLVDNKVSFYCPRPFWIREKTRHFYPIAGDAQEPFLDYPYDYPYDYFSGVSGAVSWPTEIPFESDFLMTIFGPCTDPRILINGHGYQIIDTLEQPERVTIDSKKGTIVKTRANGRTENAFDLRNKAESVFDKVPAGTLQISWPGTFGFDLTLFEERSEPRQEVRT